MAMSTASPKTLLFTLALAVPLTANAQTRPLYTKGHADILVEYDKAKDALEVVWRFEGATVGGQVLGEDHDDEEEEGEGAGEEEHKGVERPIGDVILATSATFARPASSAFDPLGVQAGQSVYYLPQNQSSADQLGVPFVGLEFEAPNGTFTQDQAKLRLIAATKVDGTPINFAIWKDGGLQKPNFFMSSADGITAADVITLAGHEHYEMSLGFADAPADIALEFEATANKTNGTALTERFVVSAKTCNGACVQRAAVAPVLGGFGSLALALGLGGATLIGRRRQARGLLNA